MKRFEQPLPLCTHEEDTLAYLAGQSSEQITVTNEAHINNCDSCRDIAAHFARSIMKARAIVEQPELSEFYQRSQQAALEKISQQIVDQALTREVLREESLVCTSSSPWRSSLRRSLPIAASLAIIIFISLTIFLIRRDRARLDEDIARSLTLLCQSTAQTRPFEFRLSGLAHAPYQMRGGAIINKNLLSSARKAALTAVKCQDTPKTRHMLARVLIVEGNYEGAIAQLTLAAEATSENVEILGDCSIAKAAKGEREAAMKCLNLALSIDPVNHGALFNRAVLNEMLGNEDAARADWQSYLKVDSSSAWAREARERMKVID